MATYQIFLWSSIDKKRQMLKNQTLGLHLNQNNKNGKKERKKWTTWQSSSTEERTKESNHNFELSITIISIMIGLVLSFLSSSFLALLQVYVHPKNPPTNIIFGGFPPPPLDQNYLQTSPFLFFSLLLSSLLFLLSFLFFLLLFCFLSFHWLILSYNSIRFEPVFGGRPDERLRSLPFAWLWWCRSFLHSQTYTHTNQNRI